MRCPWRDNGLLAPKCRCLAFVRSVNAQPEPGTGKALKEGWLYINLFSFFLSNQIRAVAKERLTRHMGEISPGDLATVEEALRMVLEL